MKKYLFYISQNYSFDVLRPLQKAIWAQGNEVAWFIEGTEVNLKFFKKEERLLQSVEEVFTYNPIACFVPGNMIPRFFPGLKVSVRHGFLGFKSRKKDNFNSHFIIRDCFDLYCTHGPTSTGPFIELAQKHQHFQVAETGFCKMDHYFDGSYSELKSDERPTILFSSTFSPRFTQASNLLPTIEKLSKDTKWKWWVTFHPKMAKDVVEAYRSIQHENLELIETDQLAPYMQQADVMLGDNSSMITDFLLLNKPVVTFNNAVPQPSLHNITNESELDDAIEYALTKPAALMEEIRSYGQITHPYSDGLSSERTLKAVDDAIEKLPQIKAKPLNIIRNLKLRKKFGYWKF
jgi:hypothetical protein